MGFFSKLWENWGIGKICGIEIKPSKQKPPAIKEVTKKKK